MVKHNVHLSRLNLDDNTADETVRKALDKLHWKKIVPTGATVTIKVNATHFDYLPGLTTAPDLVAAYVRVLRDRAERVIVGDSDLQRVDGDLALKGCKVLLDFKD